MVTTSALGNCELTSQFSKYFHALPHLIPSASLPSRGLQYIENKVTAPLTGHPDTLNATQDGQRCVRRQELP